MDLPDFLTRDSHDQILCTGHRIGLLDIVHFFREGFCPEMIAGQFPTLSLALVYKVIGFYLENQIEVDVYIDHEQEHLARQRRTSPQGPSVEQLRQRLTKMQQVEVT